MENDLENQSDIEKVKAIYNALLHEMYNFKQLEFIKCLLSLTNTVDNLGVLEASQKYGLIQWELLNMLEWVFLNKKHFKNLKPQISDSEFDTILKLTKAFGLELGLLDKFEGNAINKIFRRIFTLQIIFQQKGREYVLASTTASQLRLFDKVAKDYFRQKGKPNLFKSYFDGIEFKDLVSMVFSCWTLAINNVSNNEVIYLKKSSFYQLYKKEKVDRFFKEYSLDIETAPIYIHQNYKEDFSVNDLIFQRKRSTVLIRKPFFKNGDDDYFCYSLSILSEFMKYFLYDTLRATKEFNDHFGGVFEEYVSQHLSYLKLTYIREKELEKIVTKKSRKVDFYVNDNEAVTLIEVKSNRLNEKYLSLGDTESLVKTFQESIIKGTAQLLEVSARLLKLNYKNIKDKEIFGLVITFQPYNENCAENIWTEFLKDSVEPLLVEKGLTFADCPLSYKNILFMSSEEFDYLTGICKTKNLKPYEVIKGIQNYKIKEPLFSHMMYFEKIYKKFYSPKFLRNYKNRIFSGLYESLKFMEDKVSQ